MSSNINPQATFDTYQDIHLVQHVICGQKLVRDPHSEWPHWMCDAIGVRTYVSFERCENQITTAK